MVSNRNRKFTDPTDKAEAESKEKHDVSDPLPELTITSPCVHSRVHSNTFTMGNHVPESIFTLCQGRFYPPVRHLGFGLCSHGPRALYTEKQTLKFRVSLFQYMYTTVCTNFVKCIFSHIFKFSFYLQS